MESTFKNKNRGYQQLRVYALASTAESVSGIHAYKTSGLLTEENFQQMNSLAYKLENGLLKLVESLERKQIKGDWVDHLIVEESNTAYFCEPTTPTLHHSTA